MHDNGFAHRDLKPPVYCPRLPYSKILPNTRALEHPGHEPRTRLVG
jgi:hypothetical protein